ncbi:hypothetical protein [Micromonospora sp. RTGN7]|uniref:hypothetical protein n=1 Tax=Micromonospora sp. RTGN7 TaxID=3016526 RepID=UPI0029FEE7A5|nr:hypothetical protein [Micromonospora sp. RTGN7]
MADDCVPECVLAHPHPGSAVLPPAYGDATVRRNPDGTLTVLSADRVIGVSVEVLAAAGDRLPVDPAGAIALAGDPAHRYLPVRFAAASPYGTGGRQVAVIVCERLDDGPVTEPEPPAPPPPGEEPPPPPE